MSLTQIKSFSKYVLRTPSFPTDYYLGLLDNYTTEKLIKIYQDNYCNESIFIASSELKSTIDKWITNPIAFTKEKSTSIEFTLLRYIARMSSRCTPFGLFSGCSVGKFTNQSNIVLDSRDNHTRITQFDMHYWVSLLQEFSKRKEVRDYLIYYPNSSIYSIGDHYRFVEYKYVNTKREHNISAIPKSDLLEKLVVNSYTGISIQQMLALIVDEDSEKEEALEYIHKLIDFQFFVSSIDATITGSNDWDRVLNQLKKIPVLCKEKTIIETTRFLFQKLDSCITPDENIYKQIKLNLNELGVEFDEKYLFQTDITIATISNNLDEKLVEQIKKSLFFLNGIRNRKSFVNLDRFIQSFIKRYEDREMSLAIVLDSEIGIGFTQNSSMNDSHPILENFVFPVVKKDEVSEDWDKMDFVLESKMQEVINTNNDIIVLSEADFSDFESTFEKAPITFSVITEVIQLNGEQKIFVDASSAMSAAKLIGRFCNVNPSIYSLAKEITLKEETTHNDKLLAEIVHIPESRTGNVLRRPVLREYEIAYLSNSGVAIDKQISVSDLLVSVRDNRIVLKSKKHNKEVLPYMSNAHNFRKDSLPVYHFLCELQSQINKPIYSFNWGALDSHYSYFPRVLYKNIILSKAKWVVKKSELEEFYTVHPEKLQDIFSEWKTNRKLPQYVNWVLYDNTLLLDLEKEIGVKLFLDSVKNLDTIVLEEFLFTDEGIVKDVDGNRYANQVILSFYKEKMN